MYIGIRSNPANYPVADPIPADAVVTMELAATPTRLGAMDETHQEQLVNWGYVICDAGLRSHVLSGAAPGSLPYPGSPISREA
jgi:NTE family protein